MVVILKSIVRELIQEYSKGRKVGEILIDMGYLTKNSLRDALEAKKKEGVTTFFGEYLVQKGIITDATLDKALKVQAGSELGSLLSETTDEGVLDNCEKFGIAKSVMISRLMQKSGMHYVDLSKYTITEQTLNAAFNVDVLKKNNVILFEQSNNILRFATCEIGDVTSFKSKVKAEASKKGMIVEFFFAFDFEIARKFDRLNTIDVSLPMGSSGSSSSGADDSGTAVEFVNSMITDGVRKGASDIHLEPRKVGFRLRYRIDGLLSHNELFNVEESYVKNVVSRIKIMSGMDIAVKMKPQDGIIRDFAVAGEKYDLRVNSIQTLHGEKIVARIAKKDATIKSLEDLGFMPDEANDVRSILHNKNGLFYIAGATGSGKTTTLYSMINELNTPDKNICTIEDPIEREIADINQVQVASQDSTTGMTPADYLRAFLRQDPDIIVMGETRDRETADVGMRAGLTGHFVISTIHANGALDTVNRLYDMDIDTALLGLTLCGVMTQRLARKVCTHCAKRRALTEEEIEYLAVLSHNKLSRDQLPKEVMEGKGCSACSNTGYKGRIVIPEVVVVDHAIKKMIADKVSTSVIESHLLQNGHRTLGLVGLLRVKDGTTNLAELRRVL